MVSRLLGYTSTLHILGEDPPTWDHRTDVGRGGISPPLTKGTRRDDPALYNDAGASRRALALAPLCRPPTQQAWLRSGGMVMSTSKHDVEEEDTAPSPHAEGGVEDGRLVEPLCARTYASASASVALPLPACTHVQHPRSLRAFFRLQVVLGILSRRCRSSPSRCYVAKGPC